MEEKGFAIRQHDLIAHDPIQCRTHFLFRAAQIDKGRGMTAEGAELITQTHIDGGPVNALDRRAWLNGQFAIVQPGFNIAIA
jgi:hypothetical protein